MKSYNYSLYRLKYLYGQHMPLTSPVDVSMELSSLCNMHCTYCYHADKKAMPFKQQLMTWETASKILKEAAELETPSIKMNWRGESSINPIFPRVTALAKNLSTDSTFIERISNSNFKFDPDNESIFKAFCNQTKVKISYDSFRPEVFNKQRAGGIHELTTRNIDRFYNYKGRDNEIVIQAVRTTANKDEDFHGELLKRWPSASISIRDVAPGRSEKDYDNLLVKEKTKKRVPCKQAFVRLIFAYDGTPTMCCPDISMKLAKLGNIHDISMLEMFNCEEAKQLRKDLISKKAFAKDPCKNCSSHESFEGYQAPSES